MPSVDHEFVEDLSICFVEVYVLVEVLVDKLNAIHFYYLELNYCKVLVCKIIQTQVLMVLLCYVMVMKPALKLPLVREHTVHGGGLVR